MWRGDQTAAGGAADARVPGRAEILNADPQRIAVCGESAGGALSAVMCLLAKEQGGPSVRAQARPVR